MTYLKYNILLYILSPVIWIYFLCRGFNDNRYWHGLLQRLGFVKCRGPNMPIHLHCASVGESIAAIPLIQQITTDFPNNDLWITTTTPTGKQEIQKIIRKYQLQQVRTSYLPIDWNGSVKRFINRLKPTASILMETEIWPNLTRQLSRNNIPVILANARLSKKSLEKYLKRKFFSEAIFNHIALVAAQYQSDADHFVQLGVEEKSLTIVGSTKFDININNNTSQAQKTFAKFAVNGRPCWLAASIHPDEFKIILSTHCSLLKKFPNLLLIAVPRHPEAFAKFKSLCDHFKLSFVNKSEQQQPQPNTQVIVGDTMGDMLIYCGAADLAFVGGSLIPRGGHNPLEPAACGIPIAIGPSVYNFSDVCQIMQSKGTINTVVDQQQLEAFVASTISDKPLRMQRKQLTKELFNENRGSAKKISQALKNLLPAI